MVNGLVADNRYHRQGIGKKLLEKAKDWSIASGGSVFRVRTNVIPKEAHKFYEQSGFREIKQQKVFEMEI